MNRINSTRSLALAFALAAFGGSFGCAVQSSGDGVGQSDDDLRAYMTEVEAAGESSTSRTEQAIGNRALQAHPTTRLGPSPEPWKGGESSGPSPEPWQPAPDQGGTSSGGGTSGGTSGSAPGNPNGGSGQ